MNRILGRARALARFSQTGHDRIDLRVEVFEPHLRRFQLRDYLVEVRFTRFDGELSIGNRLGGSLRTNR